MLDFLCKESYDLRDFVALITFLRSPDGCPWDQVQTHESIRRNFLEETYEVCEAIDAGDTAHLKEELGDVLMQVLFHTDIILLIRKIWCLRWMSRQQWWFVKSSVCTIKDGDIRK